MHPGQDGVVVQRCLEVAAVGAEMHLVVRLIPEAHAVVRVGIRVGETPLPRAVQTQIHGAGTVEDAQTLPRFAGAHLAHPEMLSVRVSVQLVGSITKCVALTVAHSHERFPAQMCGHVGPRRSLGWSRAGDTWGVAACCYQLSAGERCLHLQRSNIGNVLASETSADPGMA